MINSNGMNPESRFHFYDIHTHLNFSAFDIDREEVFARAREAGVGVINVGTQKDTSLSAVEFAEKHEGAWAVVGLHPIHTCASHHDEQELGPSFAPPSSKTSDGHSKASAGKEGFTSRGEIFDFEYYKKLAMHPKVVAIGECGLDYYRENQDSGSMIQEEVFKKHIELAIETNKPLMLHIRNGSGKSAYKEAFQILESYLLNHESIKGNLHFFAGTIEEARPFLDLGFTFSFTGVITFARSYDEVIRFLPLDSIMSETDAPYVAPVPFRGQRNEPTHVIEVVKKMAEIRGISLDSMTEAIEKNVKRVFRTT